MIRLLIYEDNDKLRQSLELFFSSMEDLQLCGSYSNCRDIRNHVNKCRPDVVLMDIDMPGMDGIKGVGLIKEVMPEINVLMYTVFDDDQRVFNSLAAGANGYLLKTATPAQLYDAILDINTGGSPMSPGIARRVLDTFRQKEPSAPKADLTAREKEILQMLTKGYTYKRISAECNITIDTTRTHIKNIYTKLHVNCGTEAVAKAMMMKLLD
jgi:DNA-binding NarL/FixJ family response regulator